MNSEASLLTSLGGTKVARELSDTPEVYGARKAAFARDAAEGGLCVGDVLE